MGRFKKIANVGEIERGRCKLYRLNGVSIAIFNAAGAFYAVQDGCSGDGASLSEGALVGSAVVCASDKALFYLPTGECLDPSHLTRLTVYEVRVVGDEIKIAHADVRPRPGFTRRDYRMDYPLA